MWIFRLSSCLVLLFGCSLVSLAQTTITGTVSDQRTGETIVGAKILIKNTNIGTLTNAFGKYFLSTETVVPFTITCSAIGFEESEVAIYGSGQEANIYLAPKSREGAGVVARAFRSEDVFVSASKLEERKLASHFATYKSGLLSLRESPSPDFFMGLASLPEVQVNTSSLAFISLNTRGFADAQNWRFVQQVDGVDLIGPGLNYAVGNLSGPSELDMSNVELVAGPGSALYGPNAFNGALSMTTKSPFDHQGISAYLKAGVTSQSGEGANPYGDFAVRYAHAFNEKIALKLNFSYLGANEWAASDESYYISNELVPNQEALLALPRTDPNYNAVNVYGDEIQVPVNLGGGNVENINRSGIAERDLIDYDIDNFKINFALHYKLTPNLEAIYDVRHVEADAILRHTTIYPFRDIQQTLQKLELRSDNFYVRAYNSRENANNSYQMLATGAFIQEGLKSSLLWSQDYGAAFRGEVPNVDAGSHEAAREFADRDIPGSESEVFQTLLEATLTNPDVSTGGSQFIDKSGLNHIETNYDISEQVKVVDLQVGGSFRRYRLNSQGNIFYLLRDVIVGLYVIEP
ncbi:MAG: carboxypeptidase-like regulatory domain-containing protein [Bacteroidota bacterium]